MFILKCLSLSIFGKKVKTDKLSCLVEKAVNILNKIRIINSNLVIQAKVRINNTISSLGNFTPTNYKEKQN